MGASLRDLGVYVMGAARYATGRAPSTLQSRIRWNNGVDAFAGIEAEFSDFTYSADVSIRMHPYQEMLFHGEVGVICMSAPFNTRVFGEALVELHTKALQVEIRRFPADTHYVLQVEAFARALRNGDGYPVSLEFSLSTQAMMDRVFAQAKTLYELPRFLARGLVGMSVGGNEAG